MGRGGGTCADDVTREPPTTASRSCTASTSTRSAGATRSIYGTFTLAELETQVSAGRGELDLEAPFFQTNHEGEFCEYLHRAPELADAADRQRRRLDALLVGDPRRARGRRPPAVEVHISDVSKREDWRKDSVFDGLSLEKISGEGAEGYRRALEILKRELGAVSVPPAPARARATGSPRGRRGGASTCCSSATSSTRATPSRDAMADVALAHRLHRARAGSPSSAPSRRVFVTDFRYVERASEQVRGLRASIEAKRQLIDAAIAERLAGPGRLRRRATSVRAAQADRGGAAARASSWCAADGLVEPLRRVKDEAEIAAIAAAAELTDAVLAELERPGSPAAPSTRSRVWIETRMRELGAAGPSFPPIVAAGAERGAAPRRAGRARDRRRRARRLRHGRDRSTATAPTARGPSRPASSSDEAAVRSTSSSRRPARGARRGPRRRQRQGGRRRRARASSPTAATATTSAMGSATGSASRSTRRRACRRAPRTTCWPATSSRSSPASTCPASSGSGSRTSSSSPTAASTT